MKSTAHWQADFYKTQPDSYRRAWWRWAADQPNFIELYKLCDEKEPEIIKVRERWYAVRNVRANACPTEHQAGAEGRQDHPDMPVLR